MICIKCQAVSTSVRNSRPHKKQSSVWRRRHCTACGYTFTTNEAPIASESLSIIYKDGDSVPFSLPRLTVSIASLLTHHQEKAPDEAYWLSETVYQLFMQRGNGGQAVTQHEFLSTVYEVLNRFDALAGLQYAAKYKIVTNIRRETGRPRLKKSL